MNRNKPIIFFSQTSIINGKLPSFFFFLSFNLSSSPSKKQQEPRETSYCCLATCIASLQSCAHHKNLRKGKEIHAYVLKNGFLNTSPLSVTSLVNMYSKCNQMRQAVSVFSNYGRNVFVYNAMISGFVGNGFALNALEVYREMRVAGVMPDRYTLPCLISCCCDVMEVCEVKKIHGLVFKLSLDFDVFVGSALASAYLKFVLMEDAQKVFEELPVRDDVVLWNAMINGYAQIGWFNEALGVFMRMGEQGVMMNRYSVTGVLSAFALMGNFGNGRSVHGLTVKMGYDSVVSVSNALIDMYGKCKSVSDAMEIFKGMDERDILSWNSIMSAHEQCRDHDQTLILFRRMLTSGIQPDLVTVTTILPTCAHLAALMNGREIHGYMIVNGFVKDRRGEDTDDVLINNAVMDMYVKCGSTRDALSVFDKMINKDVASWNIMIMGYGMHGCGNEALNMFSCMCNANFKPDEVTFVGVLSACSHAGFVSKGQEFLQQMNLKYGVVPTIEHYTCVIDMLGRAGKLEEAYELAVTMPVEMNSVVWRALLAACQLHGNADLAEVIAQQVFELEPGHSGNYVLMSNVYVAAGRYEEVLDVRDTMRQQMVRKTPGCSWLELKNRVHAFITGDRSHPEAKFIYDGLHILTAHLRGHDHVPDV